MGKIKAHRENHKDPEYPQKKVHYRWGGGNAYDLGGGRSGGSCLGQAFKNINGKPLRLKAVTEAF